MADLVALATQFVDLALNYERWDEIKELPADEVRVLVETVAAAGFRPTSVVPGKLRGHYLDEDGSRTRETYSINSSCPYKVICQNGDDYFFATGWLDSALYRVLRNRRDGADRQQLIEVLRQEIERSVPLEPIRLTAEGDLLHEDPPSARINGYLADHTRDDHKLISCAGVHAYCNGYVDRGHVMEMQDALLCRKCHLRVLFPREIQTYGELRQLLASRLSRAPA